MPCFRNWSDIKPLRMKHHLRDVLSSSLTGQMWRKSIGRDCRSDFQSPEISRQHSAATYMITVAFMILRKSKPRDPVSTEEVEPNETCRPELPIAQGTASQKIAYPILRNPAVVTYHSRAWQGSTCQK